MALSDPWHIRDNISNWHMDKSPKMMWHRNSLHDRHACVTWQTKTYMQLKNDYAFSYVALSIWNELATCSDEIMTRGRNYSCTRNITNGYDLDATSSNILPHR